ncbi:hypothetical protein C0199_00650 [Candidatus Bathyarchaeota archaeon]|nr:MAG: hypothetical protein C0199_00650 [Candidatus Bathyarchaeota archaeon]
MEFEGTLEKAALKECLWMENSEESQEGENDETSQQHAKRKKSKTAIVQLCPSKLPLKAIQP